VKSFFIVFSVLPDSYSFSVVDSLPKKVFFRLNDNA